MDKKKIWIFINIILAIVALSLIFFINLTGYVTQAPLEEEQQKEKNYVKISWEEMVVSNVIKQKIAIATECIGPVNEENCNWQYHDLATDARKYNDYDIGPKLKFYKVIVTASDTPICKPECRTSCGLLPSFGWVDSCSDECIRIGCEIGEEAYCCLIDSDSQGWYDLPCNELANVYTIQEHLIEYDGSCHLLGEECTQESETYIKFTQGLNSAASLGEPSINWIVNFIPESSTGAYVIQDSEKMLKLYASVFDYVAYWDPSQQTQYGTARGLLSLPHGANYIITGPFTMQQGKSYFTSAKYDFDVVWVGKMPEKVEFRFKYIPETFSENYIVLPFNTEIKKASQLCDIRDNQGNLILDQGKTIFEWDVLNQLYIPSGTGETCDFIQYGDFDLEPGKVYLIYVQRDGIWQQK